MKRLIISAVLSLALIIPVAAQAQSPASCDQTAFVRDFHALPNAIWDKTLAAIQAGGDYSVAGPWKAKDPATWVALFRKYGGPAGVASWSVSAALPSPTGVVAGLPTSGPSVQADEVTALADKYYTGVVGTQGGNVPSGILFQAYLDGKIIGQAVGSGDTDTSAFGASFGLNPNSWYGTACAVVTVAPVAPVAPVAVAPLGPVAPSTIARLRGYITNLTRSRTQVAKLRLYQARLIEYLAR